MTEREMRQRVDELININRIRRREINDHHDAIKTLRERVAEADREREGLLDLMGPNYGD